MALSITKPCPACGDAGPFRIVTGEGSLARIAASIERTSPT